MHYIFVEALERLGPEWVCLLPAAATQFKQECNVAACRNAAEAHRAQLNKFPRQRHDEDDPLEIAATVIILGSAPAYRYVYLVFDLKPLGDGPQETMRVSLSLSSTDGESMVHEITEVHQLAWRHGAPIDATPDEARPTWLSGSDCP